MTVQRVTHSEQQTTANGEKIEKCNDKIHDKFKEGCLAATDGDMPKLEEWNKLLEEDQDFVDEFARLFDNLDVPEVDNKFNPDTFDMCLNVELTIPTEGHEHPQHARPTKRSKDH